ncbi:tRNA (N6-threonylcarbamoyladenosine(37)-N6)-methyltransferase TrmO [Nocardia sp. NPDC050630]|uniref:tRNA (N6-threonylcarbamoyladenosine(37)-N6)-methyltransferase TrmO n=1 Tax=Nocardia sp. NPDC050630 TaxID=3364321 RepID=UPI0037BA6807
MPSETYDVRPIGRVRSPLTDPAAAPKQGDEGAPHAEIVLDPEVTAGTAGLRPGDEVLVFTWLHRADRQVLTVHPRGDRTRPVAGVFATRAPHRPNPIGLHRVTIADIAGSVLTVHGLEAIDGTPVLDLKPVLGPTAER